MQRALSMGVDKAVWIHTGGLEEDHSTTVQIISRYLMKQEAGIVLTGKGVSLSCSGQVGPGLAESLGIPVLTCTTHINAKQEKAVVKRELGGRLEYVETTYPFLVTIESDSDLNYNQITNEPIPSSDASIKHVELDQIFPEEKIFARTKKIPAYLSQKKGSKIWIEGDVENQVQDLVARLHQDGRIL